MYKRQVHERATSAPGASASPRQNQVAAIQSEQPKMFSMQDMERIIKQQFQQHLSVSAATSTSGPKPNTGGKGSGGKNKNTAPADAWCYYCLQKGHYSRDEACTKPREDRAKGIYRPTYKDPPMSLEEFKALPTEIKTKGK